MSAPSSTFNYTSESNLSPAFPQSQASTTTTTTTSTTTTELNKDKEQRSAALYPSYADVASGGSGSSNTNLGKPIIFGPPVVHHERTAPLTLPSGSSAILKDQQSSDFNFTKDSNWKEDAYVPSNTLLPDLSQSRGEWEMKSAHIMQIKKQEEAARLAAQSGAAHLKGMPVMDAVNKVEHKCDSQCEKECTFIKGGAEHPITEADVLAIRQHDLVAEQAASAGSKLQKAGFLRKAVHVSDAAAVVNATKTSTGPTMMQSIGNKARGVSSAIGEAVVSAKDTIVEGATTAKDKIASGATTAKDKIVEGAATAKDTLAAGASTAKDKLATKKDQLMDTSSSSAEFDSTTTIDSTTTTTEVGTGPTRMQRVSAAATTVKDTLYDAGQRAAPVIQKAAVIAGQVLQTAAHLATPVVHHLATAIAEGTAADKKSNLQTETINTTTTEQQKLKPDIENREIPKDTLESSSATTDSGIHTAPEGFRTKPFDSSYQPTTAGEFMSKEVKSRPPSPALASSPMPPQSDLSANQSTLPAAVQPKVVVVLPDSALAPVNYNVNDQQGSNFNKEGAPAANFSIDIQVKQKNNLNSNDQQLQQQQFNSGETR